MILITVALMAASFVMLVGVLVLTGFKNAGLHYTIAAVFTIILAPTAAFPLVVMSDRLRTAKAELEALLRLDSLTELPNRRAFFEQANSIFARGGDVTLMMIDVDHFKQVNDNYGHDTGDCVLRSVARSIDRIVAETPANGERFAARIGGEEFAVLVEGVSADAANRLADQLVQNVRNAPVRSDGRSIALTLSIGIAGRGANETPDTVLRAADNACYRAKRLGRDQWRSATNTPVWVPGERSATAESAA